MPSRSKAQHNLMAMVANNPKAAKRTKIPQAVGEEFMQADRGRKFGPARPAAEMPMKKGGKCYAKGGSVRGDGCVTKGHTKGKSC